MNRRTDPGGTGEIDAPIQETVARLGLALGFIERTFPTATPDKMLT
jgi:hypothetical protein